MSQTLIERLWTKAKIGTQLGLGPLVLKIQFSRRQPVSNNRWRALKRTLRMAFGTARQASYISSESHQLTDAEKTAMESKQDNSGVALIVGVGPGLGSSLARRFAEAGMTVVVAARNAEKLDALVDECTALSGAARAYGCDATRESAVKKLFRDVTEDFDVPRLVIYNAKTMMSNALIDIETPAFEECWRVMCLGGFLVGREAARAMLERDAVQGTILFTGATASIRGSARFINMAVPKAGLRSLSQSMARELGPQGIHVAHVILDGEIMWAESTEAARTMDSSMRPEDVADAFYFLHTQPRSTWTQELDLRPWVEKF